MNATDFILSRLDLISKNIPNVGLRYAYDTITDFHIIEVYPESIRRGNDVFIEMEYNLLKDFHSMFQDEDLLISEVDDTNDMSNLIYEKEPSLPKCDHFDETVTYYGTHARFSRVNCSYYSDYYSLVA